MKELDRIETALVSGASHELVEVVHGSLWPDLHVKVHTVRARPSRIRKIPARQLEVFVAELERIGGVSAVLAALDTDKRVCAARLRGNYTEPVAVIDENGVDVPISELADRILDVGAGCLRSTVRDAARRLTTRRRAELLDCMVQHATGSGYWSRNTAAMVLAELAADGEIDITQCQSATQASVVSRQIGSLYKFPVPVVADVVCSAQDSRAVETVIAALWSEANDELLDAIAIQWRDGAGGDARDKIANLLAAHGLLRDGELAEAAYTMQGVASQVLAQLVPSRREIVLRALPASQRLGDVAPILEGLGAMSEWAVCDVLRRGQPVDVVHWLRRPSTGAILAGSVGIEAMTLVLDHWTREEQDRLVESLCNYTFTTSRGEIAYLALHGPGAGSILGGTGTMGSIARKHLYDELGASAQHWDYLRGLLPTWRGSVSHLARAVRKMAKVR